MPDTSTNENIFLCNSCTSTSVPHFKRDVLHLVFSDKVVFVIKKIMATSIFKECCLLKQAISELRKIQLKGGKLIRHQCPTFIWKSSLRQVALGSQILIQDQLN